jgi:predicted deacylase
MTANKAQGQTLLRAAIHMEFHAFAHGQLFVACSRVGLAVFCPEIPGQGTDDNDRVYTTIVVYPEVLEAFGVGQAWLPV